MTVEATSTNTKNYSHYEVKVTHLSTGATRMNAIKVYDNGTRRTVLSLEMSAGDAAELGARLERR